MLGRLAFALYPALMLLSMALANASGWRIAIVGAFIVFLREFQVAAELKSERHMGRYDHAEARNAADDRLNESLVEIARSNGVSTDVGLKILAALREHNSGSAVKREGA